jgi:hypothetical protein
VADGAVFLGFGCLPPRLAVPRQAVTGNGGVLAAAAIGKQQHGGWKAATPSGSVLAAAVHWLVEEMAAKEPSRNKTYNGSHQSLWGEIL